MYRENWLFWATENENSKEIKNFLTGNTSESQQYEAGKGGISFCFCPPHSKGKFRVQYGNSDCKMCPPPHFQFASNAPALHGQCFKSLKFGMTTIFELPA